MTKNSPTLESVHDAPCTVAVAEGVRVKRVRTIPVVQAKYDAAQTTTENYKHWQYADGLSAPATMTPAVRRVLRNRSRYEVANNSYAAGIVDTLAEYLIGTGPRLQLLLDNAKQNNSVEEWFDEWAQAVHLAEKLKTMRKSYAVDGEAFALLTTNPNLETTVKLDIRLVEADRIETPIKLLGENNIFDGIEYDQYGNPAYYYVLKTHPGDLKAVFNDFDKIPASSVVHWFKHSRPGQLRGVPELTPCLNLFAQLRRYTLAVLAAAETAAEFAMVIFTKSPPGGEAAECEPMDKVELERRMATVLPEGWEMSQVRAEQPTTSYPDFKHEIVNEIARGLGVPFNVAAGNSAGYNYASGRLDHQVFFKCIKNLQAELWLSVLEPILRAWLFEASLIEGYLPQRLRTRTRVPHEWFFDGNEHVDPMKEANAQDTRLRNFTTTYAAEYARQGKDYEKEMHQIAKEKKMMDELGIMRAEITDRLKQEVKEEDDDE